MSIFITGEIGINHNGDVKIAKDLILGAKKSGANAVKFQKRTLELVYTQEQLESFRDSPWGKTFKDQKKGIELDEKDFFEIDSYCKEIKIDWYVSCWDVESQKLMRKFNCKYNKVASAMLAHDDLIKEIAKEKKHTFISTGMHSIDEIKKVVEVFKKLNCPFELMHTVSTYPMNIEDANLKMIYTLRKLFKCNVGYSGHEVGRAVSVAAAAMGITSLERHITLDRTSYGSDQSASLEIAGFGLLIDYVRTVEKALGDGEKKILVEEKNIRKKLAPIV